MALPVPYVRDTPTTAIRFCARKASVCALTVINDFLSLSVFSVCLNFIQAKVTTITIFPALMKKFDGNANPV
jgi:hypothetical protein